MEIRINNNGSWQNIVLTDQEVAEAKKQAFDDNLKIINGIDKQAGAMATTLVSVLASCFVKHVHYYYEEAAKKKAGGMPIQTDMMNERQEEFIKDLLRKSLNKEAVKEVEEYMKQGKVTKKQASEYIDKLKTK